MSTETQQVLRPETVKVGDGVTEHIGSDRYAGTVTYVSPSGKTIRFTHDEATPNGPVHDREQYDYSYQSVPEKTWEQPYGMGPATNAKTARWSEKRQRYMVHGRGVSAGRHHFYDPHF